jgi:hypothetical protein
MQMPPALTTPSCCILAGVASRILFPDLTPAPSTIPNLSATGPVYPLQLEEYPDKMHVTDVTMKSYTMAKKYFSNHQPLHVAAIQLCPDALSPTYSESRVDARKWWYSLFPEDSGHYTHRVP